MEQAEYDALVKDGISAAESGEIQSALIYLNRASGVRKTPLVQSYRAFCLAKEQGRYRSAAKICQQSINLERNNSAHFLILGRLFLMSGDRTKAISTFRRGLKASPNPLIIRELKMLGLRKPALFVRLERGNPINRFLGKAFNALGLR